MGGKACKPHFPGRALARGSLPKMAGRTFGERHHRWWFGTLVMGAWRSYILVPVARNNGMSTLPDIEDLPDDPELAFLELVGRYKDVLILSADKNGDNSYKDEMSYLVKVISAAKACDLNILSEWKIFDFDPEYYNYRFLEFNSDVEHYLNIIRIRHARRASADGVRLSVDEKDILHDHIEKIRQIVASSSLADERKEKIYAVLHDLALEVSRDRTRFERISTFTRKLAGLSKHTADEGVMPWAKVFLAFWGVLDDAKEDEQRRLPPPAPHKSLPPPNKPNVASDAPDDTLPF